MCIFIFIYYLYILYYYVIILLTYLYLLFIHRMYNITTLLCMSEYYTTCTYNLPLFRKYELNMYINILFI